MEKGQGKEKVLFSSCIRTDKKKPLSERIFFLGKEVAALIESYKPEALATETLYFSANQKTAMGVAEARGVILYEASKAGIPIYEYTPIQIKIAVTGYGKAAKADVLKMTSLLVELPKKKTLDDEIDAIAIGLTCFAREKFK